MLKRRVFSYGRKKITSSQLGPISLKCPCCGHDSNHWSDAVEPTLMHMFVTNFQLTSLEKIKSTHLSLQQSSQTWYQTYRCAAPGLLKTLQSRESQYTNLMQCVYFQRLNHNFQFTKMFNRHYLSGNFVNNYNKGNNGKDFTFIDGMNNLTMTGDDSMNSTQAHECTLDRVSSINSNTNSSLDSKVNSSSKMESNTGSNTRSNTGSSLETDTGSHMDSNRGVSAHSIASDKSNLHAMLGGGMEMKIGNFHIHKLHPPMVLSSSFQSLPRNPITLFRIWFNEVLREHSRLECLLRDSHLKESDIRKLVSFEIVWSMNLATSTSEGVVGNRWVLFKGITMGTDLEVCKISRRENNEHEIQFTCARHDGDEQAQGSERHTQSSQVQSHRSEGSNVENDKQQDRPIEKELQGQKPQPTSTGQSSRQHLVQHSLQKEVTEAIQERDMTNEEFNKSTTSTDLSTKLIQLQSIPNPESEELEPFFDCAYIQDPGKECGFTFFTHWDTSRKARDLIDNEGICSLAFYWPFIGRQVRIEGKAHRLPREECQRYWESRSEASRRGAYISQQSQIMNIDRNQMIEKANSVESVEKCPPSWGGFSVVPHRIEFWENGNDRVHDRLFYEKISQNTWEMHRMFP